MKVIFMGTPEFAKLSLEAIIDKHEVIAVFTQPDKPNQRGKKIRYSAVKQFAIDNDIKVYQPTSVRKDETLELVKELNADMIVVVAYGKILPEEFINIPPKGVINVHGSLLPKYRGAAPIHYAIVNGEEKTGVTIMYIDKGLDSGDMILKRESKIEEEDTLEIMHDKLAKLGSEALVEAMELLEKGEAKREAQNHDEATFCRTIEKDEAKIDWTKSMKDVYNFVRGMNPFPCAFTLLENKRYKIYEVEKNDKDYPGKAGEVVDIIKGKGYVIKVGDKAVILKKVKPENKKMISGKDMINGNYFKLGELFN